MRANTQWYTKAHQNTTPHQPIRSQFHLRTVLRGSQYYMDPGQSNHRQQRFGPRSIQCQHQTLLRTSCPSSHGRNYYAVQETCERSITERNLDDGIGERSRTHGTRQPQNRHQGCQFHFCNVTCRNSKHCVR